LIRITAYAQRFIVNLRARINDHPRSFDSLSAQEIRTAENFWICFVQSSHFTSEFHALKKAIPLPKSSRLKALNPFIGPNNLIRLDGRLDCASLNFSKKHPVILTDHRIVRLIIDKAHKEALHGGAQLMLRIIRQRFWILSARSLVKGHVRRCVTCTRYRALTSQQQMAALPTPRVNPTPPFSVTGIDYAGPFFLTSHAARGQRTSKNYVAIFVCFATKAVHLENVEDYSTAGFLAAFHSLRQSPRTSRSRV
jgi:hypothetical protein